jgi:hypothetical protein
LQRERPCNLAVGFTAADAEFPAFFSHEPLVSTHRAARFHVAEEHDIYARMDHGGTEGVPDK